MPRSAVMRTLRARHARATGRWDRHPWSRGSYSLLKPLQYAGFHGIGWEPEGSVCFAGEHTSEASSGYMNGAVETSQRAAAEVLASLGIKIARTTRRAA